MRAKIYIFARIFFILLSLHMKKWEEFSLRENSELNFTFLNVIFNYFHIVKIIGIEDSSRCLDF